MSRLGGQLCNQNSSPFKHVLRMSRVKKVELLSHSCLDFYQPASMFLSSSLLIEFLIHIVGQSLWFGTKLHFLA